MSEIATLSTETQVRQVILLMLEQGMTRTAACKEVGIPTRTYDRYVASNPQLINQVRQKINADFLNRLDEINENRLKNLAAFLEFSEDLRASMLAPGYELKDNLGAFNALLKLDAHLTKTTEGMLPVEKKEGPAGPARLDDEQALAILAQLRGADLVKVTRTTTLEVSPDEMIQVQPEPIQEGLLLADTSRSDRHNT
jgi:hypothetical protein